MIPKNRFAIPMLESARIIIKIAAISYSPIIFIVTQVNALKECSYGIIDQLISLYVMMHTYYFEKKGKKPKVNGDYVMMVSRKYFPYMKQLNNLLKDPMSDSCLKKASEQTKNHLKELLKKSEEQNIESEAK